MSDRDVDWLDEVVEQDRHIADLEESIPNRDEMERRLVLFYWSRNHDGFVNQLLCCERVEELCKVPQGKAELMQALRKLADEIEKHY